MLVLNSFGLQNALERQPVNIGHFFARCHSCAMTCATLFRDSMAPAGFLKYSPDSHFVQMSYAVLTLLKVFLVGFVRWCLLNRTVACPTRILSISGTRKRYYSSRYGCRRMLGEYRCLSFPHSSTIWRIPSGPHFCQGSVSCAAALAQHEWVGADYASRKSSSRTTAAAADFQYSGISRQPVYE